MSTHHRCFPLHDTPHPGGKSHWSDGCLQTLVWLHNTFSLGLRSQLKTFLRLLDTTEIKAETAALESIQISLRGIQQFWKTLKKALSYRFLLESFSLRAEQPTAVVCCFVVAAVHWSHPHPADVYCPHKSIAPKKEEREAKPECNAENPAMTPSSMLC